MLSLDEVAEITRCEAVVIGRLLSVVPELLPGSVETPHGWRVPLRALRTLLGSPTGPLPVMATIAEVAACVRRDVKTVYAWLKMRGADGVPVLPHKRILGVILVDAAAVMALPMRAPGPPSSFFASKRRIKAEA